ncbi:Peroxidase [Rhynchospora pubera]|uniref:Peroxidase n=1 Tax=Rhynchospora pubera TaxID=906938 RepID=A0AAV8DTD4_9POAL|nr:Peroxidase [Rhynchospora pubera]
MAIYASSLSITLFIATSLAGVPFSLAVNADSFTYPPLETGLSFNYYESTCPQLEPIVRHYLWSSFKTDIGLAAGLLRLHFHDCFVQGCDASVLLDGSASGPSEQQAPPNLTLRPAAFKAINDIRALIDKACGVVVSCADVVALAARDSVALSGGPNYKVPLGRRDGLNFASQQSTLANLPAPTSNVSKLLSVLNNLGLDANDLVALSGGHTIGLAHCTSFTKRLYPTQDSTMNQFFASELKLTCPESDTVNTTVNDIRTPNIFDNMYYVDLVNREGLFTSDQDLYTDSRTNPIVSAFAINQQLFFQKFVYSIVKMGQLSVLTGSNGEIRANCSAQNPSSIDFLQLVINNKNDSPLS